MRILETLRLVIILSLSAVILIGCSSFGVGLLPKNRAGFNGAMITSEGEQLLLNIVRLRFEDSPFFINVDSITTSNSLSYSASLNGAYVPTKKDLVVTNIAPDGGLLSRTLNRSFELTKGLSFNPSGSYSDNPTVSYSPLQGEKFTTELLTPIDIPTIYLLLESGWSIERLFRVLLYKFGNYENISSMTLPGPPDFKKLLEILDILRELQLANMIYFQENIITQISITSKKAPKMRHSMLEALKAKALEITPNPTRHSTPRPAPSLRKSGSMPIHPTPSVDIVIDKHFKNHPKILLLYKLLGFTNAPDTIHLVDDPSIANTQDAIIAFRQRTFLNVLYYLRNAVEISPDMVEQGLIELPRYKNGRVYDTTIITKGLMKIYMSDKIPTRNANIAVHYRNHWFYIKDNDLSSKRTLTMLQLILNLTSGNKPIAQAAPVLTIPVR